MKKLPKTFRGAEVMRGLAMKTAKLDALVERKALVNFDAEREMWLVVADDALQNDVDEIKAFASKETAVRYARACANGNVNHRVLRVTGQVLVVATCNEL